MNINDKSQIIAVKVIKGNTDARATLSDMVRARGIQGKVYRGKGYISQELFASLYRNDLTLITGVKHNMKNYLISTLDKIHLRKRFIIENVFVT